MSALGSWDGRGPAAAAAALRAYMRLLGCNLHQWERRSHQQGRAPARGGHGAALKLAGLVGVTPRGRV